MSGFVKVGIKNTKDEWCNDDNDKAPVERREAALGGSEGIVKERIDIYNEEKKKD